VSGLGARLRCERGQGLVSSLLLLAGVLIPLLFLVPLFARLELARLAADQAARDAARSAVQAPGPAEAEAAAHAAVARAQGETGVPLRLALGGEFGRGGVLRADVTARVAIGRLPVLGSFGTVVVRGDARAPVDRYRSLKNPP
jgi:hypothetical protein